MTAKREALEKIIEILGIFSKKSQENVKVNSSTYEECLSSPTPSLETLQNPYFFSNDRFFETSINNIENAKPIAYSDKIRIALLIGESSFLSLTPELSKHADIVVCVDIDKSVLENNEYLYKTILANDTITTFLDNYLSLENPIIKSGRKFNGIDKNNRVKIIADKNSILHLLNESVKNSKFQEKHFLLSEKRFKLCKNSTENLFFAFVHFDLLSKELVTEFKETLQANNIVVSVFNVTNLLDYDANVAIRNSNNNKTYWKPTGNLNSNLLEITNDRTLILCSKLDFKENKLSSKFFKTPSDFNNFCQAYEIEANKGKYASIYKSCKNEKDKFDKEEIAQLKPLPKLT